MSPVALGKVIDMPDCVTTVERHRLGAAVGNEYLRTRQRRRCCERYPEELDIPSYPLHGEALVFKFGVERMVSGKCWERGKAEDFEAVAFGYHSYTVSESMTETARKEGQHT